MSPKKPPKGQPRQDAANVERYETPAGQERFRARIRVHGKRFSRSFDTKEEAQDWRDDVKTKRRSKPKGSIERPRPKTRRPESLTAFIRDEWWADNGPAKRLDRRTRRTYFNAFKKWVVPSPLGGLPFQEIDSEHILDWHEWCRKQGAGEPTIRQAQKVISNAYSWAAQRPRRFGVKANPVSAAEWPTEQRSHDVHVFEHRVIEAIRQEILSVRAETWARQRAALLLSLMSQTGMRPYEARHVQLHEVGEKVIRLSETKVGSPRNVPLWVPLRGDIDDFAARWELSEDDYLIGKRDGGAMSHAGWENWRDNFFNPARDEVARQMKAKRARSKRKRPARLEAARVYDLCRHSYAAQQIAALMPLADLAEIMGHSAEVLSSTYMRQLAEREGQEKPLDPEAEVIRAREMVFAQVQPNLPTIDEFS